MTEWIILFIVSLIGGGGIVFAYLQYRIYALEREVKLFIEEYRTRLNGSNRFLMDENLLYVSFPEYSEYIVHIVWGKLVANKAIERDIMDGAWCIK